MGFILSILFFGYFNTFIMADFVMKGMYAPVYTPFDDNGAIDTSVLDDYGKYISERGVKGIIVADSAGEGPNLREHEKKVLLKCWMPIAKKYKLRVVAQIGGVSFSEMISLAKFCERLKVDAMIVLPTLYFQPKTVEQMTQILEAISKAAPSTPILYDYQKLIKIELDLPALFSLATARIPNFVGMAVDLPSAEQISAFNTLKPYQFICIRNHVLISAAAFLGYNCFLSSLINVYPQAVALVIKYGAEGNSTQSIYAQTTLNNIAGQIAKEGNLLNSHKVAMEVYAGIKVGDARIPVQRLSDEARENIKAVTDTIDSRINNEM